jgi:hypothetical protein
MKPLGRVLVLLCVALAVLLSPAGAAASSSGSEDGSAKAHLVGTHGYRITIDAFSEDLIVTARKGSASVSYVLFNSGLKGERIHARLPGVGRIFLKFHEHRLPHGQSVKGCRKSETVRKGVFVGTVKIEGERGYTSAVSHHVRGEIAQEGHDRCDRRPTARASDAGSRLLSASTSSGNGRLIFNALDFPWTKSGSKLVFGATFIRARGRLFITTSRSALAKHPTDLEIAAPPRSASVTPPAPFTGSATFQQEAADQFGWTGDLAVELPGVGEVSLAGPKFETAVCVGHKCRGDKEEVEADWIAVEILG